MRIDYTHSRVAPVLICFVRYNDKFLLVKRSNRVLAYKNLWSSLAGFIDDQKSIGDKIREEITEELGLKKEVILKITPGPVYSFKDEVLQREWIRHLFVADISTPSIKLDWEHTDYEWIDSGEIKNFETTPGLAEDLEKIRFL